MEIIKYPLRPTEYIQRPFPKKAVVLHFTAGWPNPYQTIDIWNTDNERKGTAYVIGGMDSKGGQQWDGKILEAFDSSFMAYHLFRWFNGSEPIEQQTIGIELCNWGPLTLRNGQFYTYVNTIVPKEQVCELATPFKGFKFWHAFTDNQIQSLRWLLVHLMDKHDIPVRGLP